MKTSTITDIDGNVYKTVIIGNQEWMAENLNVTRYSDGTMIPQIVDGNEWVQAQKGAYCIYDNQRKLNTKHGLLYNWYAITDYRRLAPNGFKIPSMNDWIKLEKTIGDNIKCGEKMKSSSGIWRVDSILKDEFNFNALPSGRRDGYEDGDFEGGESYSYNLIGFWAIEENLRYTNIAWNIVLGSNFTHMEKSTVHKQCGNSVRCFRNI